MSRAETCPVSSMILSAMVLLPWSMCAIMQKLRIYLLGFAILSSVAFLRLFNLYYIQKAAKLQTNRQQ